MTASGCADGRRGARHPGGALAYIALLVVLGLPVQALVLPRLPGADFDITQGGGGDGQGWVDATYVLLSLVVAVAAGAIGSLQALAGGATAERALLAGAAGAAGVGAVLAIGFGGEGPVTRVVLVIAVASGAVAGAALGTRRRR